MMYEIYYHREIERRLVSASQQFPVVLVTGPRQAGKSTLLVRTFPEHAYVTLDDPAIRNLANQDPELFLSTRPGPLIIDEIQYAPKLFSYIKIEVDKNRRRTGYYLLTGSQLYQLMQDVSESLAGRIAILTLYPFSWNELSSVPDRANPYDDLAVANQLVSGFFPEQLVTPGLDIDLWFSSYIASYLERDVRNMKQIADLNLFQTFISLLAARAGNLLNISAISRECGISQPTAKAWLSILQATSHVYLLKPYFRNITKRVVKSPKLYFIDTGLLCHLLGIDSAERFYKASEKGGLFENMVIIEMIKCFSAHKGKTNFYFYRSQAGVEVDLIVQRGARTCAVEIKLAKSINLRHASGLQKFTTEHKIDKACVASLRSDDLPLTRNITTIHWSKLFDWLTEE